MKLKDWSAEERPREKLLLRGAKVLSNAELLAIFISSGTPGTNAVDAAQELLSSAGGRLTELCTRTPKELTRQRHRGILFFKVENDTEFHPLDLDVAGPGAGLGESHGEGGKQQDCCGKDSFHRLNRRFGLIELVKVQIPVWTSNTYPRIMLFL